MSLEAFAELVGRDEARIDLARGCLMIAQDAYPALEVERYLGEIERMALRLRTRLPRASGAEERINGLNEFLFDELGEGLEAHSAARRDKCRGRKPKSSRQPA